MRISFILRRKSIFCVLLLLMCSVVHSWAQQTSPSLIINTTTTESTCAANGSIKVTLQNGNNYTNVQYSVKKEGSSEKWGPQSSPLFENLSSGAWTVIVNATPIGKTQTQEFTKNNVTVGGNYKPLDAKLDKDKSNPSYANCGSGTMRIIVTGSNATKASSLIFKLKSGPGIATERVIKAVHYGDGVYQLEGEKYLPGIYKLSVDDGCSEVIKDIEIPAFTQLPEFKNEKGTDGTAGDLLRSYSNMVNEKAVYMDCNAPVIKLELTAATSPYIWQWIAAGKYEVALSPTNEEPTNDKFQKLFVNKKADGTITQQTSYKLSIAPKKISDFYGQKLKVTVRLTDCPTIKRTFEVLVRHPNLNFQQVKSYPICGKAQGPYTLGTLGYGLFCYPVTVTATRTGGGDVQSEVMSDPLSKSQLLVDLGKEYTYSVKDANGKVLSFPNSSDYKTKFTQEHKTQSGPVELTITNCGANYRYNFRYLSMVNCAPYDIDIVEHYTNKVVQTIKITTSEQAEKFQQTTDLKFNVYYRIVLKKGGKELHFFYLYKSFSNDVQSIGIEETGTKSVKGLDQGDLEVKFGSTNTQKREIIVRKGGQTGAEVGRGNNFEYQTFNVRIKDVNMPPGQYTLEIRDQGCPVRFHTFQWYGFYNHEDFGYDVVPTCGGLKVIPKGYIIKGDQTKKKRIKIDDNNDKTLFRIISGPSAGFDKNANVAAGKEGLILTQNGRYMLAIFRQNNQAYNLDSIEVTYNRQPLSVRTRSNAAYSCANGSPTGHILVKGQGGVPPYRYELWDADNQNPIMNGASIVAPKDYYGDEIAHFEYGKTNDKFTVRIYDACGSNTYQQFIIGDLGGGSFASTPTPELCIGETIQLQCLPLFQYEWYRPGDFQAGRPAFSTEQNPIIENARLEDSGDYVVVVKTPFCGNNQRSAVKITVHPCTAPVNPHLMQRVLPATQP